jgi:hypothetical protein
MVRDKVGRHRWSRGLINFVIYSDVTIFASERFDAVTEHVMVLCAFTTDGKSFEQIGQIRSRPKIT